MATRMLRVLAGLALIVALATTSLATSKPFNDSCFVRYAGTTTPRAVRNDPWWRAFRSRRFVTFDWNCASTRMVSQRLRTRVLRSLPAEDRSPPGAWGDRAVVVALRRSRPPIRKLAVKRRDLSNRVCVRSVPNILSWETSNEPKISAGFAAGAGSI